MQLENLLDPLQGANHTGPDLGFSAEFDHVRELRRADDPTLCQGGGTPALKTADWPGVATACKKLLAQTTKGLAAGRLASGGLVPPAGLCGPGPAAEFQRQAWPLQAAPSQPLNKPSLTLDLAQFRAHRRQPFVDVHAYAASRAFRVEEREQCRGYLEAGDLDAAARADNLRFVAKIGCEILCLDYTAGAPLRVLAASLDAVVAEHELYVAAHAAATQVDGAPAIDLAVQDTYIDFVNLLSISILLGRADLLPRIQRLVAGTEFDGQDAVIEELLAPFVAERPQPDTWLFDKPYRLLLDAIDEPDVAARSAAMRKYVASWYRSLKGEAMFWGAHEKVGPDGLTAYRGYWCMEAAALCVMHAIDDRSFASELPYPIDLADFAGARQRTEAATTAGSAPGLLRVAAGEACPRSGYWVSPAAPLARHRFEEGTVMPALGGDWGTTVWHWAEEQTP